MEVFSRDTKTAGSDLYQALGLKESNGILRAPRVLSLICSLLERSVSKNDNLLETAQIKDVPTIFHGSRAPALSIKQYIDRIFKYAGCSPSCFVVACIYLDKYIQQTGHHLTSLNVHRLLITSIMVAAKSLDDAFFNNAYYARVGGIATGELNRLEMKFLFTLDFRVQVSVETFVKYCTQLEKEGIWALQIERLGQACRVNESWSSKDDSACSPAIAR